MSHVNIRGSASCLSVLALSLSLGACTDEDVNLGGGRAADGIDARGARCSESTTVTGLVRVKSQTDVEDLAGCEEIDGDVHIEVFAGADLSPLSALRSIDGTLEIGAYPEIAEGNYENGELEALREQVDAVIGDGYLPSLHGLENLTRVTSLDIHDIAAQDLAPLLGLRELSGHETYLPVGYIGINGTALRNLHGLENVQNITNLVLADNPELESLSGVVLGEAMTQLNLVDSPRLDSLEELAPLALLYTLILSNIGITDLESLTNLSTVEYTIDLSQNRNLVNVDRISTISSASLTINDNAALTSIPPITASFWLDVLTVVDNPELQSISVNLPNQGNGPNYVADSPLIHAISVIEIGQNDKLTQVSLAEGLEEVEVISIHGNPSLASVSFGTLSSLEELTLSANTSLTSVDVGALETVDTLSIINNPAFDPAQLAGVRTFEARLLGNAQPPATP
jgi:hypothetical protein